MQRSAVNALLWMLALVVLLSMLSACAGPREIPLSERKYLEGVVVEGGVNSFRMSDAQGKIYRFDASGDVEYQPAHLHAYYGDRIGVTYYTVLRGDEELHRALKLVLLSPNPDRIDFTYGIVDGIVRASGMMRYLVYLPEHDLTVAFYRLQKAKYIPKHWTPKPGNRVKVYFTEDAGRFVKKFTCYQVLRIEEEPVSIQEKVEYGDITEIFVHRSVKRAPDRFAFELKNGDTWTMFGGGATRLVPNDLAVKSGRPYIVEYYRLLLGDQSLRYVATRIEEPQKIVKVEPKPEIIVNSEEPWTGTWKVTGFRDGDFVLKLKQNDNQVESVQGSDFECKAKVDGNRLKGWYSYFGSFVDIDINLYEDKKSFKGNIVSPSWFLGVLTGERVE